MGLRSLSVMVTAAIWASALTAAPLDQHSSTLGMNLSASQEEMPFLNVLKLSGGWATENSSGKETNEEAASLRKVPRQQSLSDLAKRWRGAARMRRALYIDLHTSVPIRLLPSSRYLRRFSVVFQRGLTCCSLLRCAEHGNRGRKVTVTALSGKVSTSCPSSGRCIVTGFNPNINARLRVVSYYCNRPKRILATLHR